MKRGAGSGYPRPLEALLLIALVASVSTEAGASRFGRDGFSGNPETNSGVVCTACHAPGASVPSLTLSGPTKVDAGSTHIYTLTLSGGPGRTAGTNVSVSDFAGELKNLDDTLRVIGDELSHREPLPFARNSVRFRFSWKAPTYKGRFDLFAAANSSNGKRDLLGDGVATELLTIRVRNGSEPPPRLKTPRAQIKLRVFAEGLDRPVAIASAGDDRLFAAEQPGRIRVLRAEGKVLPKPFLDISRRVDSSGNEQGLLGLAFHPNFAINGQFFVHYTTDPGRGNDRSRISRFRVGADADRALASSERVLLEFEQPFANHNGGDLKFGPEGMLYIAVGDGGAAGDPQDNAQNDRRLLGKLLRLDVDGKIRAGKGPDCSVLSGQRYAIPPGNAFGDGKGGRGCDEIYASGLRNPWRISVDRQTGDLWIGDVGQASFEEIDSIAAGSGGGLNFGWRCREGNQDFDARGCIGTFVPPVLALDHADGNCSITGGFVYRGFRYPSLYGRYLFTDFCDTSIRSLSRTRGAIRKETLTAADTISTPSTFGESVAGELYLASRTQGAVYALTARKEGKVIGEVGAVTIRQAVRTEWRQVKLRHRYRNPVVVVGPPTESDRDPVTVRVRKVTAASFEVRLDEWAYLDGRHGSESLGFLVVEAGQHTLLDGTRLQAGTARVDHEWRRITFSRVFAHTPVVLVQTSSRRAPSPVVERLRRVDEKGFRVRLQEDQTSGDRHRVERLGWIAIDTGVAARHETVKSAVSVTDDSTRLRFERGFIETPVLIADIQTYHDRDPAALRYRELNKDGAQIRIQEGQSAETKVRHSEEAIGYAAFLPGDLRAR